MNETAPVERSEARLAWELVAKIAPLPDVLRRHSLTVLQLKAKLKEPLFRSLVKETKKLWESELNTKQRIQVKAQLLVEDSLLDIYAIVQSSDLSPAVRVDAFEKLSRIGQLGTADKAGGADAERVTIHINIPGASQPVTVTSEKPAIEGSAA